MKLQRGVPTIILSIIIAIGTVVADEKNVKFISRSRLGEYKRGAVAANGLECAELGKQMLERGGHAVDAAITALLCDGAVAFQSMGLGGGFLMVIYDKEKGGPKFLNARETAPARSSKKMFGKNARASRYGGPAIAVPGELKGMWEAHQRYGKLPWNELFEPVANLLEKGFLVTEYLHEELLKEEGTILADEEMKHLVINPETGTVWPVNYKLRRPILAATLRTIGNEGANVVYNGTMGKQLCREIEEMGGFVDFSDLQNYTVQWGEPISNQIGEQTLYTSQPPGSGAILTFIVNTLVNWEPALDMKDKNIFWQRVIETFKFAYAGRSKLGDPNFNQIEDLLKNFTSPDYAAAIRSKIRDDWTTNDTEYYGMTNEGFDDHGTGNICVLSPDGSAVAVTSTINQILGAVRRSKSTGIIFNDEMDDFSSPDIVNGFGLKPSEPNFITPGKRPMSSMVPTIIVDKNGEVQLVIGSAGGTKITSSVSLSIVRHLLSNETIKETLDAPRVHHQLVPSFVEHEDDFDKEVLEYLRSIGHGVTPYVRMGSTQTAISRVPGGINANADYRREGSVAGL